MAGSLWATYGIHLPDEYSDLNVRESRVTVVLSPEAKLITEMSMENAFNGVLVAVCMDAYRCEGKMPCVPIRVGITRKGSEKEYLNAEERCITKANASSELYSHVFLTGTSGGDTREILYRMEDFHVGELRKKFPGVNKDNILGKHDDETCDGVPHTKLYWGKDAKGNYLSPLGAIYMTRFQEELFLAKEAEKEKKYYPLAYTDKRTFGVAVNPETNIIDLQPGAYVSIENNALETFKQNTLRTLRDPRVQLRMGDLFVCTDDSVKGEFFLSMKLRLFYAAI